jgi:hypothetical protein
MIVCSRWLTVVLNAGAVRNIFADDVHGIVPTGNPLVLFGGAYVD